MNHTPTLVVSTTMDTAEWQNSTLICMIVPASSDRAAIVQQKHGCASPLLASARQTLRVRSRDDSWAHRDRDGR